MIDVREAITRAHHEEWARREGCTAATINGRPGWERVLASEGWRKTTVCLEKEL